MPSLTQSLLQLHVVMLLSLSPQLPHTPRLPHPCPSTRPVSHPTACSPLPTHALPTDRPPAPPPGRPACLPTHPPNQVPTKQVLHVPTNLLPIYLQNQPDRPPVHACMRPPLPTTAHTRNRLSYITLPVDRPPHAAPARACVHWRHSWRRRRREGRVCRARGDRVGLQRNHGVSHGGRVGPWGVRWGLRHERGELLAGHLRCMQARLEPGLHGLDSAPRPGLGRSTGRLECLPHRGLGILWWVWGHGHAVSGGGDRRGVTCVSLCVLNACRDVQELASWLGCASRRRHSTAVVGLAGLRAWS